MELALVVAVIAIALVFDYTNGFHDAANAIATSVSTRALTPRVALLMAAVCNFGGAFVGTEVAQTVGKGIIESPSGQHGLVVVASALLVRSYATLRAADPGFNGAGTLTADIPLLFQRYPQEAQAVAFFTDLTERLRAAPDVVAVGAVSSPPLDGGTDQDEIKPEGWTPPPGRGSSAGRGSAWSIASTLTAAR